MIFIMEENYHATSSSSSGSLVPLIMGGLGMLLGIVGLIFGMQGKSRAISVENQIAAIQAEAIKGGSTASRLETLELQLSTAGKGDPALKGKLDQLEQSLHSLAEQTIKALHQLEEAVNDNRARMGGSSASYGSSSRKPSSSSNPGGTYVIQGGDNFWSIAKKLGLSPKAIEAANPDLNPKGLKLGQTINLPK